VDFISFLVSVLTATWHMLVESSVYILFGLLVGGLLKMFLSPAYVARHLGRGRFLPVFKAALFGIPIPLCSCGVLPAAATLKKQGANNGATAAFLISTPESGVDSISISYALLDPIMTIARPVAAFVSAMVAGIAENLLHPPKQTPVDVSPVRGSANEACCGEDDSPPLSWRRKVGAALKYSHDELWGDLAGWFFLGLLAAGLITVLVPDDLIAVYFGGGLRSMLLMLLVGIPLYICATASTPIAAAMILKGVSPGAALVFLLVGPATNITSISVLFGILGKRATALYLLSISLVSVICGLLLDFIYLQFGLSAKAAIGQAAEVLPVEAKMVAVVILLLLSIKPFGRKIRKVMGKNDTSTGCGCGGTCAAPSLSSLPVENGRKG